MLANSKIPPYRYLCCSIICIKKKYLTSVSISLYSSSPEEALLYNDKLDNASESWSESGSGSLSSACSDCLLDLLSLLYVRINGRLHDIFQTSIVTRKSPFR